jgi:hypothetical protein
MNIQVHGFVCSSYVFIFLGYTVGMESLVLTTLSQICHGSVDEFSLSPQCLSFLMV